MQSYIFRIDRARVEQEEAQRNTFGEEKDRVKCHIEQCLRRHMSREETMHYLLVRCEIYPGFTKIVWEMLQDENPEFFSRYYLRLMMNIHIVEYNRLRQHVNQIYGFNSDGPHVLPTLHVSIRPVNGSPAQPSTPGIYDDPSILSQNGNMGLAETMNQNNVRTQAEPSTQNLNATLLDGDTSAVGSSAQAPNLTEFPRSSLIENLPAPEPSEANNIVDSHGDTESRSDPASGSSSHQNLGGD